ncbi:MAG: hypothetical protein LBL82_06800 [Oscillospiraceae bacterium]|jgi:hypothetical protein|nr:hypothetical protein [Oscillospiraceae bacterium]
MTVSEAAKALNMKILAGGDKTSLSRDIRHIYTGDLLSWVMAKASEGDAWFTVMGNINALAVASLADCACIILVENAVLDANAKEKADSISMPVLQTGRRAAEMIIELDTLMKTE